nr:L,D-transpeptidase catalytic domain [Streptococcus thermophilus]
MQKPFLRSARALAVSVGVAAALVAAPVPAQAQPTLPQVNVSSSPFLQNAEKALQAAAMQVNTDARNAVWDTRNALRSAATTVSGGNKAQEKQLHTGIDRLVEAIAPGLIAQKTPKPKPKPKPAPKPAPAPAPRPAPAPAPQPGGCAPSARACVDLKNQRTWLQRGGKVSYGPVRMASGKPGHETPKGFFYVNRKVKDEISWEFNNAPMPYATYFTNNGIAFHQGDPSIKSHGCIRMYRQDAQQYFNSLQIGDQVHVF